MFLLSWVQPRHCSFYCPDHHRHLGRNILRLKELSGGVGHADHDHHQDQRGLDQNVTDKMPRPEFWTAQKLVRLNRGKFNQVPFYKDIYPRNQTEARLICPSGCLCKASDDDIEVKQKSFSVGTMSVCIHTTPRYWECQEKKMPGWHRQWIWVLWQPLIIGRCVLTFGYGKFPLSLVQWEARDLLSFTFPITRS